MRRQRERHRATDLSEYVTVALAEDRHARERAMMTAAPIGLERHVHRRAGFSSEPERISITAGLRGIAQECTGGDGARTWLAREI